MHKIVKEKLDYASDFMTFANKSEGKLKVKQAKLCTDLKTFEKWDNP